MSEVNRVGSITPADEQVEENPVAEVFAPEEDEPTWTDPNTSPNEELWLGGPTFEQVEAWKKEHGDIYVTSVTPDTHYVWRTIKRSEYRNIVKELERRVGQGTITQAEATMDNEEMISSICILFPKIDLQADDMAGVAAIISQEVLEASGFQALEVRQL